MPSPLPAFTLGETVRPRTTGRSHARRLLALGAAALAVCGATLGACGGKDGKGRSAAGSAKDPVSIPLRTIFSTIHAGGDPQAKQIRTKQEALARAKDVAAKARVPGASFPALATELSEDVVSAADEGYATFVASWTKEAPEILKAASELKVGEVSDPVETPFGYHVLQRLSREEGKALENLHAASVEGFFVQWHELVPTLPDSQTKEQAYAEAVQAVQDLRAGKVTNVDAQAHITGAVPFEAGIRKRSMPGFEAMSGAVLQAKVGDWPDPIETPRGWAVIQRLPYLRAYIRHLVVAHRLSQAPVPRTDRMPQDARARAEEALDMVLKNPDRWNEAVEKYTDEASTKATHGFIGEAISTETLGRRMAPELIRAIFEIPPGKIGPEVVTSRYGYHVIWRVD